MIILGIDPGFINTGFGVMKKDGTKVFLLDCGLLSMSSASSISERIGYFYDFFDKKLNYWQIQAISLETPFLGKNAQSFLKLGYLRGILYLLSNRYNLRLFEFAPRQIKLSLTGFGSADKDQVARVIVRLFPGLTMPKKFDLTDALAVTLCGIWQSYNLK